MNIIFAGPLGGWELVLIFGVILILFGAKKLPELAKGLGSGIKEFKKAAREVTDEVNNAGESSSSNRKLDQGNNQSQSDDAAAPSSSTPPKN